MGYNEEQNCLSSGVNKGSINRPGIKQGNRMDVSRARVTEGVPATKRLVLVKFQVIGYKKIWEDSADLCYRRLEAKNKKAYVIRAKYMCINQDRLSMMGSVLFISSLGQNKKRIVLSKYKYYPKRSYLLIMIKFKF